MIWVKKLIKKIQEVRLLQALVELECLSLFPLEKYKLKPLKKRFSTSFSSGKCGDENFSSVAEIDHKTTLTRIGGTHHPLIFSWSIADNLKVRWKEKRNLRYSFAGLVIDERRKVIEDWLIINNENLTTESLSGLSRW